MVTAFSSKRSSPLGARLAVVSTFAFVLRDERVRPSLRLPSREVAVAHGAYRLLERAGARDRAAGTQTHVSSRVSRRSAPSRSTLRVTPRRSPPTSPARAASTSSSRRFPVAHFVEPALTPAAVPGGAYQWQYVAHRRRPRARPGRPRGGRDSDRHRRLRCRPQRARPRGRSVPMTYNAVEQLDATSTTSVGHGTFVASLAAGSASNGEGHGGSRRRGAADHDQGELGRECSPTSRWPPRSRTPSTTARKIVNLSLGGTKSSQTERRAARVRARRRTCSSSPPPATRRWRETPSRIPQLTSSRWTRTAPAATGSPSAPRRSPARAPTSRTTAPTSRSPPRAKRSSARSRRTRRR